MTPRTVTFAEVSLKATRRWVDETGKKRQKTQKFSQTLNPFNRDADGNVKTRPQILVELHAQRDKWILEFKP